MGYGTFPYQVVYLIHLACIVVGFGSSFVYPVLAVKARKLPIREAYAINHAALEVSPYLTIYPIYGAGAAGIAARHPERPGVSRSPDLDLDRLPRLRPGACSWSVFLHSPNLKAMDALQAKLVDAPAGARTDRRRRSPSSRSGARRRRMYGGILHLFWLILMIDMIWKPGIGS